MSVFKSLFKSGNVIAWIIGIIAFGSIFGVIYICCCRKGGIRGMRRQGPWVAVTTTENSQTVIPQQQYAYPMPLPNQQAPGSNTPYPTQGPYPYYPPPTATTYPQGASYPNSAQQQPSYQPSAPPPSFNNAIPQDLPPSYQEAIMQKSNT